jgi:hypothetical protein
MTKAQIKNEIIWLSIDIEIAERNGNDKVAKRKTEELKRLLYILETL